MHRWGAVALADEVEAALGRHGLGGIPRSIGLSGPPDVYAGEGAVVQLRSRSLEVIPTPGHTRGHVVFADPSQRLLFAGDHILPHITPSIGFEPFTDGTALVDYLSSLAQVRSLPVDRILPAHGPDFTVLAERVRRTRRPPCHPARWVRRRGRLGKPHGVGGGPGTSLDPP